LLLQPARQSRGGGPYRLELAELGGRFGQQLQARDRPLARCINLLPIGR
jgi:hypothetical protein